MGKREALEPIRIACGGGESVEVDVIWRSGVWAVHVNHSMDDWLAGRSRRYAVTHVPSGYNCGPRLSRKDAIEMAKRLFAAAPRAFPTFKFGERMTASRFRRMRGFKQCNPIVVEYKRKQRAVEAAK